MALVGWNTGGMLTNTTRLSTRQAADYLGIPEATLRWFRHKGDRGPRSYALTARHVVYDLADLQSWADAQKAQTQRGGAYDPGHDH
jgi:predicted DNA-binding transcriptional regulator AlpA